MKRVLITATAAALAAAAWGAWEYEGEWGGEGMGDGRFNRPGFVAVAPNGNVYVADQDNDRVQYFTPTGSFLGKWGTAGSGNGQFECPCGIAVTARRTVYVTEFGGIATTGHRVQYFTLTGSFLGKWGERGSGNGEFSEACGIDAAANGNVYVAERGNHRVQYFTRTGSFLGKWGRFGTGPGEFNNPFDVKVSANDDVYVTDHGNKRVQYFTSIGSYLDQWKMHGSPAGAATEPDGGTFCSDFDVHAVFVFTRVGSLVSSFGEPGSGKGQFDGPLGVALSRTGARCYVTDLYNNRVQYFNRNEPAVVPASLGRVKALFR